MAPDGNNGESPTHAAARLQVADGSLAQIRALHSQVARLTATVERSRPLPQRISRGVARARRNGWRLHTYPRAFWRGFRATGTGKLAGADLDTLRTLSDQGAHDQAMAFAAALLPLKSGDAEFLDVARHAFARPGALSLQLQATEALVRVDDSPSRQSQLRNVVGRIRETEPDWLPAVPTSSAPADPVRGRVVHLLKAAMPYRQSGYTMRSQYIVDSQRAAGLDPVVITALGFPGDSDTTVPDVEVIAGSPHHHLGNATKRLLKGPPDLYLDAYAEAAAARVAEVSPSIIHVHSGHRGYEPALVGLALAREFDLPLVYEVRGFFESLWSREAAWNERGELYERRIATEIRCMRAADAVVTLSESMRAEIMSRGIDGAKVHVVPNGVDVSAFHPGQRDADLVAELGLQDRFVFGYVSNLDHRREGHETLIRAAARLRANGVPAVALIVGDGNRRAELEQLAAAEGAGDSVLFAGRVPHDRVLDYYRLLDVFVVPRIAERAARLVTPLKPFEAMAAGIPVVASELAPLLEIVGDGERGRSFPPGDADALTEVLTELRHDEDARNEMAKRARDWVVAERQWSSNAARYAAIYAAVTGGGEG
ncbi:glycosyltransferase family 4 protein [Jiangella mangrovi]|uniref:Glycosyltransferase involved in cell wall biosynthesis n=1 Tax=Jiangella mangrovi TaxID=1524084 RepID=A0A7W9GR08_9ACTN|nr:glycosyltransferase family 4 protein [Jiangella mangrovi]MBB5788445.1 glycosyltransferase involved in cell wall biosynthesis [Jiangella mangrovi]